jgi:Fe-coproporphyrin III synthase
MPAIGDAHHLLKYFFARLTGRVSSLPVLVLMPHSRCNCKCVMCDIWKANADKREIKAEDLAPHLESFRKLGVKRIVVAGGEPLMHSNLWTFCKLLKTLNVHVALLSTGLLLKDHAAQICEDCNEVIVSLDGSREVHNEIRRIPQAYEKLEEGVRALRAVNPRFRVTGRCVLQRQNYRDLPNVVEAARSIALDRISFLPADVSSNAFNRPTAWTEERASEIALNEQEIRSFESIVEQLIQTHAEEIQSGFIAESADKLRRLPSYYNARKGLNEYPPVHCNAPWVSAVVEADGTVRPCFFHRALGNIHERRFDAILNGKEAVAFRKQLHVDSDPTCRKCVCTLYLNPRAKM